MATSIDKRSVQLMMDRYQRELDELFKEQEATRAIKLKRKYSKGGKVKAYNGLTAEGPNDWDPRPDPYRFDEGYVASTNNQIEPWLNRGPIQMPEDIFTNQDRRQVNMNETWGDIKGWGKDNLTMNNLATISPMLLGAFLGSQKTKQLDPKQFYNPYANQVASLMRNRRVNVQPQLDAVLNAQRIANYNASRVGAGGMGNIQGNFTAIGNNAMRNRAGILANKQNMDLGYMGEEAQSLNREGMHRAGINLNIADWNQRAKDNKLKYWTDAVSQASQLAQVNKQMANQLQSDQYRTDVWRDMYGQMYNFMPYMQDIINSVNIKGR